MKEVRRI